MADVLPDVPFHDAEVLAIRLDREGPTLELDVDVFAQMPEAQLVRLRFTNVSDLEIGGFNGARTSSSTSWLSREPTTS